MKKILYTSLLGSALLMNFSCNNGKLNTTSIETENTINVTDFVFELEGVFPTNDRFQLFYSNDNNFLEENSVNVNVYGQSVMQKVTFNLPTDVKPQNLRLDLGSNVDNSTVSIRNIRITYKDQEILLSDNEIRDFFPETESVTYDILKLNYSLKPGADGVFDPIWFSNEKLKRSMNQLYNNSNKEK